MKLIINLALNFKVSYYLSEYLDKYLFIEKIFKVITSSKKIIIFRKCYHLLKMIKSIFDEHFKGQCSSKSFGQQYFRVLYNRIRSINMN